MILHGLSRIGRNIGICGVVVGMSFGLLTGTALGQSAPGDMLFEPALNVVLHAPFTVTVEWTSTETPAEGNPIYHRRVSRILRDSLGRQRFEDGPDEAGPHAGESPTVRLYNPAKRLFASLDAKTGVARISTMGWTAAAPTKGTETTPTAPPSGGTANPAQAKDKGVTREALEPRDLIGLHAEGVRTTTKIPAGRDGSPAYTITDDVWQTPEWKMPLLHIHTDSRGPSSQAQVTALDRSEPDAALLQPPSGYTQDHWEDANKFSVVLPKVSPLPAPILDDDLAKANDRMFAASTAHTEDLEAPYHERYELTMTDYRGQKHTGSYESWINDSGSRREIHTDSYNYVFVMDFASKRRWESKEGVEPLRVQEFYWDQLYPEKIQQSLLHPYTVKSGKVQAGDTIPTLVPETAGEAQLTCATNQAQAKMCFDLATGFLVSGSWKSERVEYEGWHKIGMKYRESRLRILQDSKPLVEARLALATDTVANDEIFQKIDELREIFPGDISGDMPRHQSYVYGYMLTNTTPHTIHCYAQARVSVNEKGKVAHAELEDADDEQCAAAALDWAKNSLYKPYTVDGKAASFDTTQIISLDATRKSSY
ncbi:MAG: hypothetical protein P4K80_07835 [Acidobacteriaceae bacterium]|nr:hypothetical protein [Acidobacteriaceae bacterium]